MKNPDEDVRMVLVVEDEATISNVCRRALTAEGFEVDVAVNGKIAQDMVQSRQYDLLLVDIKLPVVNGVELYKFLQDKHPDLANRVIFTTGSVFGTATKNFLEGTNRPLLPKPFTTNELKAIVANTLRKGT